VVNSVPRAINGGLVGRVDLAPLVRLLVVELIYVGLNSVFDMSVAFTTNYFFSGR
jgi:hypothetical protein